MRSKPWSLCQVQGCRRKTRSGEMERDKAQRWCSFHEPTIASKREKARREKVLRKSVCKVRFPGRSEARCRIGPPVPLSEACASISVRCSTPGLKCYDPDWKWKRKRCATVIGRSRGIGAPPVGIELMLCVVCASQAPVDLDSALCPDCC